MFFWSEKTEAYLSHLDKMLDCAKPGDIENSVYLNSEYVTNVWTPIRLTYTALLTEINEIFHPALVITAFLTPGGSIAYLVATLMKLEDYRN